MSYPDDIWNDPSLNCDNNDECRKKYTKELIAEFLKKMEFIELHSKNPKLIAREYKIEYQQKLKEGEQ